LLRTVHSMSSGVVTVLDFMPLNGPDVEGHACARSEPRLVRLIECLSGQVSLESIIDPAPDYGRAANRFASGAGKLSRRHRIPSFLYSVLDPPRRSTPTLHHHGGRDDCVQPACHPR
jgi:hypothetical protein